MTAPDGALPAPALPVDKDGTFWAIEGLRGVLEGRGDWQALRVPVEVLTRAEDELTRLADEVAQLREDLGLAEGARDALKRELDVLHNEDGQ